MDYSKGLYQALPQAGTTKCGLAKRHCFALLGFLGFFNIYTIRICLSIAIVAMVAPLPSTTGLKLFDNSTVLLNETGAGMSPAESDTCPDPMDGRNLSSRFAGQTSQTKRFAWGTKIQGVILGSYFYGYIVTQIAGGWLAKRYGGKLPVGLGIFIAALLTILTPAAAKLHYAALIAVRVGEGLSMGVCYPAMQQLLARWSPARERTRMSVIVNAGAPVGNVIVLGLSGLLGDHFGWESIFYVFGGVACLWFVLWQWLVYNSPEDHPTVTDAELLLITGHGRAELTKMAAEHEKAPEIPWRSILQSPAVWAMFAAHFGQNWGNYTLLTNLPTYMKNILKFELSANGVFSALPYLALWLLGVASGYTSDWLRQRRVMSTTAVRKLFNTLGNAVPAVALIAVGYVGCDWVAAVALLTVATGFSGFTQSSFQVNCLDLSPAFAPVIFGLSNTLANLPGFISPLVVGFITAGQAGQTIFNWHIVFFVSAAIRIVTMLVYACFASGELAPWDSKTSTGQSEDDPKKMRRSVQKWKK